LHGTIHILGSGTSMGVPTLGCECAVCTSADPRDRRSRPSISVTWRDSPRTGHLPQNPHLPQNRCVIIDTGPDFRAQALREGIRHVDAVFYTHSHADHILGLDDLRPLTFKLPARLPLYADQTTAATLEKIFDYTFSPDSEYPNRARVHLHRISGSEVVDVAGLDFQRIPLRHGRLEVGGFRFGGAAYLTDMNSIPDTSLPLLENLEVLIIDALRPLPHPSHSNVAEAIGWVQKLKPRRAWFTHMSHEISHADTVLPAPIELAWDGLAIPFEISAALRPEAENSGGS
jgi:phosphoribosyl 1,2-cyclic phosphate phosphodiesterase